jgi:hypothetical protein
MDRADQAARERADGLSRVGHGELKRLRAESRAADGARYPNSDASRTGPSKSVDDVW